MKFFENLLGIIFSIVLIFLLACGGGSEKENIVPTISNNSPLTIDERATVSLSVSANDSDGSITNYQWVQQSGPNVDTSATTQELSFNVPEVTEDTSLSFRVTVTDNQGATASVNIVTTIIDINLPPQVEANFSTEIDERTQVTFAVVAEDVDGSIVSYRWNQESGPVVAESSDSSELVFDVPEVTQNTSISFRVDVTDDLGAITSIILDSTIRNINLIPTVTENLIETIDERSEASLSVEAVDVDGSIVSFLWEQLTGPVVTGTFTEQILVFNAPEVVEDTGISFNVTVTDNDGATASTLVESVIVHINRAPDAQEMTINVEFENSVTFIPTSSDPDEDSVIITITQQPDNGLVEVIDASLNQFSYTPNDLSIASDQLTFEVSDGVLIDSAIISFIMIDTSPPTLKIVAPEDGEISVAPGVKLSITFDDVILIDTLLNPQSTCDGGVQVSIDNFVTCEVIESVTSIVAPNKFEIKLSQVLQENSDYQIKIDSQVQNFYGTSFGEASVTRFTTGVSASSIVITEISTSRYSNDYKWVEIYNGTSEAIDLIDYKLKTEAIDFSTLILSEITEFSLPEKILEVGQYIVLQARPDMDSWQAYNEGSEQLILLGAEDTNIRPYWSSNGFVELIDLATEQTVDFVRFGNNEQLPVTNNHWDLGASAITPETVLGKSMIRDINHTDTNSPIDWTLAHFITPAGENDIDCNEDLDEDGIPDCAEISGSTFAGLPLYDWGARVGVKDIFIEVDYMQSDDQGIKPQKQSLQMVVDAFLARGYAVHFDTGNLFDNADGISHDNFDLGGGNEVDFYLQTTFESSAESPSVLDHKLKNFDLRRRPIFHYLLMANSQLEDGAAGSSGLAEIYGNDLIVTMGSWGLNLETETNSNIVINFQAGTIMHELGHNLGLFHGGSDSLNYKPNYLSVMNYLHQLSGLPTIGNNEGDRFYRSKFRDDINCDLGADNFINSYRGSPDNFLIDYSTGEGGDIDEALVSENAGLGRANSGTVDFNCNTVLDETLVDEDINNDSIIGIVSDSDDWGRVDLQFAKLFSGSISGVEESTNNNEQRNSDILSFDRQKIYEETAPTPIFFEELREALKTK